MISDNEEITKDYYKKNASQWVAKHSNPNFWQEEHNKFHFHLPAGKVLDLGCGGGRDAQYFIENNYQYLGVDASEEMLSEARKRNPGAIFSRKNLYELDFSQNEFDGFWASCCLLHVPKEKISAVLNSIKRIVNPGGIGFISIKEGEGEKVEPSKNSKESRFFAYYSQNEFMKILKDNGFKILEMGKRLYEEGQKIVFLTYFVKNIK